MLQQNAWHGYAINNPVPLKASRNDSVVPVVDHGLFKSSSRKIRLQIDKKSAFLGPL